MKRDRWGNKGFSLPEVIVSMGIVALTATIVAQQFSQQGKILKQQEGRSACQTYISEVQQRLRAEGMRLAINPPHATPSTATASSAQDATTDMTSHTNASPLVANSDRWENLGDYISYNATNIEFRSAHLIDGAMTTLLAIYNSNPAACSNGVDYNYSGGGVSLLPRVVGSTSLFGMYNIQPGIRIQPYDTVTGSLVGCPLPGNLIIHPQPNKSTAVDRIENGAYANLVYAPNVRNYGLKVTVSANYSTNANDPSLHRCVGELNFQYPTDFIAPAAVGSYETTPATAANNLGGGASINSFANDTSIRKSPAPGGCPVFNTSNVSFSIQYSTNSIEAGSAIVCRDRSRIQTNTITCRDATNTVVGQKPFRDVLYGGPLVSGGVYNPVIYDKQMLDPATSTASYVGNNWKRCSTVEICGDTPTVTTSYVGTNASITLDYSLPEGCGAQLEYAFVDTAGNVSQAQTIQPNSPSNADAMAHVVEVGTCGNACEDTVFSYFYFRCGAC